MWFILKDLHPQQKAIDGYIYTIKLYVTMNPLKGILIFDKHLRVFILGQILDKLGLQYLN